MKELITFLATSLVDNPAHVSVTETEQGDDTLQYALCVAKEDLGKVIGKKGRTAKALRTFVMAAAKKKNKRIFIEIVEPVQSEPKSNVENTTP